MESLHEAIIKESVFYEVQDILAGRKNKNMPNKYTTVRDELPLLIFYLLLVILTNCCLLSAIIFKI